MNEYYFRTEDLAVSGEDLMALGLKGRELGETMKKLLREVQARRLENDPSALLAAAKACRRDGRP